MPGTYSKIYIQLVFAVKNRQSLISSVWEENLHKYITGIIQEKGQKLIAINGMPDHLHIFIGLKPSCCISDLVREIKKASNKWIKENKLTTYKFEWQEGFGAFSYSESCIDNVYNYILNQKNHHKKTRFKDEYYKLLKEFSVEYEDQYLFNWIDE